MSSPEELTFVVGRWLRPIIAVLYVVRRLGFWPTSSREQAEYGASISDSGAVRSTGVPNVKMTRDLVAF